jgi:excisionase family DNA binding protein
MFKVELSFKIQQREVSWDKFVAAVLMESLKPSFDELRLQFGSVPPVGSRPSHEVAKSEAQPRVVGINEAARLLNLRPSTIRAYVARRKIASVRIGRRVLIPVEAINEIIIRGLTPASYA